MRLAILLTYALLLLASPAVALEKPTGPVILVVSGELSEANVDNEAHFDREMLLGLTQHEVMTSTPWHDGANHFSGPLARDLLEAVGARGVALNVTALNDYSARVPVADLKDFDVILAMSMNGQTLRVRDHGPLFLIYPFDQHPGLMREEILLRSVWQINRIEIIPSE